MKIWNNIFELFSPQLSWCKEILFLLLSWHTIPRIALLFFIYNKRAFSKGLCLMSSIFISLKKFIFQMHFIPNVLEPQQSHIQKNFFTSNLMPLFGISLGISTAKLLYKYNVMKTHNFNEICFMNLSVFL